MALNFPSISDAGTSFGSLSFPVQSAGSGLPLTFRPGTIDFVGSSRAATTRVVALAGPVAPVRGQFLFKRPTSTMDAKGRVLHHFAVAAPGSWDADDELPLLGVVDAVRGTNTPNTYVVTYTHSEAVIAENLWRGAFPASGMLDYGTVVGLSLGLTRAGPALIAWVEDEPELTGDPVVGEVVPIRIMRARVTKPVTPKDKLIHLYL